MKDEILQCKKIIEQSANIVFFGGAGVSTESGIPDFRSAQGLFNQRLNKTFSPEELVSHDFFMNHPQEFYEFYKTKLIYPQAKPNAAHRALAELEHSGQLSAIITQNIDGLHQAAGSKKVFELHGSVLRNYCTNCGILYEAAYILQSKDVPLCEKCGNRIKPDVVLYGESLDNAIFTQSILAISKCETLIIGGTSLVVYPAAGLIQYFTGKNLIVINKTPTALPLSTTNSQTKIIIQQAIGEFFEELKQA